MARRNGPWRIEVSRQVFQNDFLRLDEDQVIQPDGQPGSYATVRLKPGVAILALDEQGQVYLTRQFRYALGRESVEVISGGLDEGEDPLEAARREAREECGVEADAWEHLGMLDVDTSILHCPVQLYLARGIHVGPTEREGSETIKTLRVSLDEALAMVMEGTITHGPSCALLLKAALHLER